MSTVLTAEKMHIQDAPRRLRFWRPDAAAKTFTLPAWALIVLTLIAPITIVIVMSFTDYQLGNTEVRWVGLENYSTLVLGDDFLRALKNTVLYAVLTVPASVFVGLMLALLGELYIDGLPSIIWGSAEIFLGWTVVIMAGFVGVILSRTLLLNAKYSGFLAVVVFFAIIIAVEKIYDLICPAICVNIGTSGFNPGFVLYYLVVGFILFGVSGWMADKKLSV